MVEQATVEVALAPVLPEEVSVAVVPLVLFQVCGMPCLLQSFHSSYRRACHSYCLSDCSELSIGFITTGGFLSPVSL